MFIAFTYLVPRQYAHENTHSSNSAERPVCKLETRATNAKMLRLFWRLPGLSGDPASQWQSPLSWTTWLLTTLDPGRALQGRPGEMVLWFCAIGLGVRVLGSHTCRVLCAQHLGEGPPSLPGWWQHHCCLCFLPGASSVPSCRHQGPALSLLGSHCLPRKVAGIFLVSDPNPAEFCHLLAGKGLLPEHPHGLLTYTPASASLPASPVSVYFL